MADHSSPSEISGRKIHQWLHTTVAILLICGIMIVTVLIWYSGLCRKHQDRLFTPEYQAELEAIMNFLEQTYHTDRGTFEQYLPGIVCWGDSLTAGAGGKGVSYPAVLEGLIHANYCTPYNLSDLFIHRFPQFAEEMDYSFSVPVVNMGVGGENTDTILGRNGAVPFVTVNDFTIPAGRTPAEIVFESENGDPVAPLLQGNAGMEWVTIEGVKGVISIEQESYVSSSYRYFFTRSEAGGEVFVPAGTELVTQGSTDYKDYLMVLFIGQNGGYDDVEELISQQKAMLAHQTANNQRYIIVGLHTGTAADRAELEEAMQREYGDHYINLRAYMSEQAMDDAGLVPTLTDQQSMARGETPPSLMVDGVHFTPTAYRLIGQLIFERMETLGYFDEIKGVAGLK